MFCEKDATLTMLQGIPYEKTMTVDRRTQPSHVVSQNDKRIIFKETGSLIYTTNLPITESEKQMTATENKTFTYTA